MGRIPDDLIDQLRQIAEISDVVGEVVELKGSGDNLKGLCPFHGEKTPSFNVNLSRGIFKCFGCGAGGDVFGFVMRLYGLSYPDAVRRLAAKFGIVIPEDETTSRHGDVYRANELAMVFFEKVLHRAKSAEVGRDYLSRRKIHGALARSFRLGFAPGRNRLLAFLRDNDISDDVAVRAGLAYRKDSGPTCDVFRERVVFPIFTRSGKVIGFGARRIAEGGDNPESFRRFGPKYLNTRESPVFKKGRNLYGVQLLESGRNGPPVVVVEGYTDVIFCHDAGFKRAVAGLGTALTAEQGKLIRRFSTKAILLYDADAAGNAAAQRNARALESVGLDVSVATLEPGLDPCDFLIARGPEALRKRLQEAKGFLDFTAHRLLESEAPLAVARKLLEIAAEDRDPLRREKKIRDIGEWTGFSEEALLRSLPEKKKPRMEPRTGVKDEQLDIHEPEEQHDALDRKLAISLLQDREGRKALSSWLSLANIADTGAREVLGLLLEVGAEEDIPRLWKTVRTRSGQSLLAEWEYESRSQIHWSAEDVRRRWTKRNQETRLQRIQELLKKAEKSGNSEARDNLLREYIFLKSATLSRPLPS